jgi:hypothetical protein
MEVYLKLGWAICSLAAGINLLARTVVLHGARMVTKPVGLAILSQMQGREGRKARTRLMRPMYVVRSPIWKPSPIFWKLNCHLSGAASPSDKRGVKKDALRDGLYPLTNSREASNGTVVGSSGSLVRYGANGIFWHTHIDSNLIFANMSRRLHPSLGTTLTFVTSSLRPAHHTVLDYSTSAGVVVVGTALGSLPETRLIETTTYGALEPTKLRQAIFSPLLNRKRASSYMARCRRCWSLWSWTEGCIPCLYSLPSIP